MLDACRLAHRRQSHLPKLSDSPLRYGSKAEPGSSEELRHDLPLPGYQRPGLI